ncbi:MAG: hypothetical protein R3F11_33210 [Verrucomicrobiales bacterium]
MKWSRTRKKLRAVLKATSPNPPEPEDPLAPEPELPPLDDAPWRPSGSTKFSGLAKT